MSNTPTTTVFSHTLLEFPPKKLVATVDFTTGGCVYKVLWNTGIEYFGQSYSQALTVYTTLK